MNKYDFWITVVLVLSVILIIAGFQTKYYIEKKDKIQFIEKAIEKGISDEKLKELIASIEK